MKILGIISALACLVYAFVYDYNIAIILLLFFIATKTDFMLIVNRK
jgi:hypothetical protein